MDEEEELRVLKDKENVIDLQLILKTSVDQDLLPFMSEEEK